MIPQLLTTTNFFWIFKIFSFFLDFVILSFYSIDVVYKCPVTTLKVTAVASFSITFTFTFIVQLFNVCLWQVEHWPSHLGQVLRHIRVPSHNHFPGPLLPLVGGHLDSAVAEGGVVHLDHLAAWGSRKGPCILITPQRAPRPVSQLKVLLQANLKLKQEKLIVLVLSITFNLLPLNPKTSTPSWQAAESSAGWSVSSPFPCW